MVPPRAFRELRHISRHRRRLTQLRASVRNRVHKVLDRSGCRIGGILTDIFGMNGRRILDGLAAGKSSAAILASLSHHVRDRLEALGDALTLALSDTDRVLLHDLLDDHDGLDRRIKAFLRTMQNGLTPWTEQIKLLQTLPGIDEPAACEIFIELGPDLTVFGNVRRLAAWAGVCPGNHESAGKRRAVSARRGSRHLAGVLNQCAHAASRTKHCQFKGYHRALTIRRGYKRVLVATTHKLLRTIWAVLRDSEPCVDPKFDYESLVNKRNAAHWLKHLDEHGYLEVIKAKAIDNASRS